MEENKEGLFDSHFDIRRIDNCGGSENIWRFSQEHKDQKLIQNNNLFWEEFKMNDVFPIPMSISRFTPFKNYFYCQVRKCTIQPWEAAKELLKEKQHSPEIKTYLFTNRGGDFVEDLQTKDQQLYEVRTTKRIGAKVEGDAYQFPPNLDYFKNQAGDLMGSGLDQALWRELCDFGMIEQFNDENSKYGQGQYKKTKATFKGQFDFEDKSICKIAVTYNETQVTYLEFYNNKGHMIGKLYSSNASEDNNSIKTKVAIGVSPLEELIGIEIQEGKRAEEGDLCVQSIAFKFLTQKREESDVHYEYAGISLDYDDSKTYIESQGHRLLTIEEAQAHLNKTGVLFPGEDQWAAVIGKDGSKDWVQLGDKCHTVGRSHNDFGYPDWGNQKQNFKWRNCFIWKKQAQVPEDQIQRLEVDKCRIDKKFENRHIFLSTLKIFRPRNQEEPELIREILCESNNYPAMDYGPSVIYFNQCLYYFQRHYDSNVVLELHKFDLETHQECVIESYRFIEPINKETKLIFVEMSPCQLQFQSEQDFFNNLYVVRKYVTSGDEESAFKIYSLTNTLEPVYDSDKFVIPDMTKIVCWKENNGFVRFHFHTIKDKYIMRLPVNQGCTIGEVSDILEGKIICSKNPNTYYEDWPFELKEMNVEVDGKMTTVSYYLVLSKSIEIEIFQPFYQGERYFRVQKKITQEYLKTFREGQKSKEDMRILDRQSQQTIVPFPHLVPGQLMQAIFGNYENADFYRKFHESANNRSIMMYCLGGRYILIATLQKKSPFRNIQEALAAENNKSFQLTEKEDREEEGDNQNS